MDKGSLFKRFNRFVRKFRIENVCTGYIQGRRAAFCSGASSCHLQSDNKMSPKNLKANFCTFLSILYKTAGKLIVFFIRSFDRF